MSRTKTTCFVRVDYSQPLQKMIETGEYDWVDSDITQENFPKAQHEAREVDLVIVHLNRRARTEQVEAELKKQDLRPGNLAELLTFGAKYPEVQKYFPIVALGSVWVGPNGRYKVPCLDEYWHGERGLRLFWYKFVWPDRWRFLAAHA